MMIMRRVMMTMAVCIVALMSAMNASAQGGFRFGVMGGANFSKFCTKADDYKSGLFSAFHIGPVVEYELHVLPIAIEAGVLYTQKGANMEEAGKDALKLRSNLIELPINIKGYIFSVPAARFFIIAGPSFNFAVNTKLSDVKVDNLGDIKANPVGINLNAGIGVEVLKYLQLSATFNAAMTESYKYEGVKKSVNNFFNTKEKGFSLTARLLF